MALNSFTRPGASFCTRAFRETDVPAVASLWLRVFRQMESAPPASLLRYFEEVFFRNPWREEDLPSLVCEDREARIVGFLGVVPRKMVFRSKPIRVAVSTQLMVAPGKQYGLAAVELIRRFFAGPQDFSYTDGSNETSATLWEGLGGEVAPLLSMEWMRVFRPSRFSAELLTARPSLRPILWGAHPVLWTIDAVLARLPFGPYRFTEPSGTEQEATADSIVECWQAIPNKPALYPMYEPGSLNWLLEITATKKVHGELRKVLVRDSAGKPLGWYLYYLKAGGISSVLQVMATTGATRQLLDHLFADACRHGSIAITGAMDPHCLRPLSDRHCSFRCLGRGVLIHSKNKELLHTVHRGNALLSRLDGEWWTRFGNDRFEQGERG